MKTEEERFEEWWDNSGWNTDEGVYLSHRKSTKLSWMARAALDRPRIGLKIKCIQHEKCIQYAIESESGIWEIDYSIYRKLAGRELKPGEEVEV